MNNGNADFVDSSQLLYTLKFKSAFYWSKAAQKGLGHLKLIACFA